MTETRLLLRNIDEPGLNTIEVYERLGGYRSRAQGAARDGARRRCSTSSRSPAARPRRRRASRWARRRSFIPKGTMDKYLCCNADESEPGAFKDRLLMQSNPHPAGGGLHHRRHRRGRQQGLHLHPRRVRAAGRHPRRGGGRGLREGLSWASASSAPSTASTWWCTGGRARTSAARRRACSTRSRASAATRA